MGEPRLTPRALLAVFAMLGAPMPQPPADAKLCDDCGQPMILDAMGELWMCAGPHPHLTAPTLEDHHG